jgi:hypothetical protein
MVDMSAIGHIEFCVGRHSEFGKENFSLSSRGHRFLIALFNASNYYERPGLFSYMSQ